ncbi:MAG: polysaccharide biosynthesis protein, partial [Clostridia bacterium]|nr:polysaccharide biosynthesis protein [Clostridia bacterium]
GIYGNYYYIMNSIVGIMTIIYTSLTAGLGNSLETDDVGKNYNDFNILSFLNFWLVTFCSVCLLCLYQPFMDLWVGKELMFGFDVVVLLTVYFFVYQIRRIVLTYKDAGGVWWEDRFRPYVMMFFNLTFNIILVQVIGIQGVILSTIISMLISLPWENYTVFKFIFKKSSLEYYLQFLKYVISAIAISAMTYFACYWIPYGWIGLFIRAGICVILPNVLLFLIFFKSNEFRQSMKIVKDRLKGKLGRKA